MSKKTKTVQVDADVTIMSTELDVCDSLDLIAEIMGPLAPSMSAWNTGRADAGEAFGMLGRELTGGALSKHLVSLLKLTTVTVKSEKLKVEFLDSRDKMNAAFAGRQKHLPAAVKLAMEVSLSDFLDGLKLIGLKIPTLAPPSDPSTPSTSDIG